MLRGIAFIRKPSDEWYEAFRALLDRIDNQYRTERNRFIHDMWVSNLDQLPINIQQKVEVKKPQARIRELVTHTDRAVSEDEIWSLVYSIERASTRIQLFIEQDPLALTFSETWI